jgi:paired amphipathic helix protein Sin3a
LEPIVKNIETMSPEEQEALTLSPGLGGQSTSIYERIIKKIYGVERGREVIELLLSDPARVAPLVMKRLKQKYEEWTKAQVRKDNLIEKSMY